jgi:hypothetical protein
MAQTSQQQTKIELDMIVGSGTDEYVVYACCNHDILGIQVSRLVNLLCNLSLITAPPTARFTNVPLSGCHLPTNELADLAHDDPID